MKDKSDQLPPGAEPDSTSSRLGLRPLTKEELDPIAMLHRRAATNLSFVRALGLPDDFKTPSIGEWTYTYKMEFALRVFGSANRRQASTDNPADLKFLGDLIRKIEQAFPSLRELDDLGQAISSLVRPHLEEEIRAFVDVPYDENVQFVIVKFLHQFSRKPSIKTNRNDAIWMIREIQAQAERQEVAHERWLEEGGLEALGKMFSDIQTAQQVCDDVERIIPGMQIEAALNPEKYKARIRLAVDAFFKQEGRFPRLDDSKDLAFLRAHMEKLAGLS